jgi:Ni,Fe-hydrogenase III small subunit
MWQLLKRIVLTDIPAEVTPDITEEWLTGHQQLHQEILDVVGRALCIRQIDAGSCNGCELEIHALNNPYYNIEGLGIRFVASPRHADMLLVTGPLTLNMREAVQRAWEATPHPKLVIAAGDCACTGGIFKDSYAVCGALSNLLPVDVTIPGCPPPPIDLLRGILTAVRGKRGALAP